MYKKVNVVRLRTNEKANPIISIGQIFLDKENIMSTSCQNHFDKKVLTYWQPQHLYITDNSEIKEGDWWVNKDDNSLNNDNSIAHLANNAPSCKKIISTTDTKITSDYGTPGTTFIPQIPQQFIQYYVSEYNKGNVITDVMVEYEEDGVDSAYIQYYKLKTNYDNTINIKSVKGSWSRNEVIEKLRDMHLDIVDGNYSKGLNKWIEENL